MWIMVLVIEFTDILPGRTLLSVRGANVYIFGPWQIKQLALSQLRRVCVNFSHKYQENRPIKTISYYDSSCFKAYFKI